MLRLAVGMLLAMAAFAQQPAFEVASIRPNKSGELLMLFQPRQGGNFTAKNCTLALLIQYAYDVQQFQIEGVPAWVKSDKYDIAAKAAEGEVDQIRAMLRQLLEDRFQLKYHWETKEAPVYFLTVGKAGKLKESAPGDCPPPPMSGEGPRSGSPDDAPCGGLRNSPGHTKGTKLTAEQLAGSLSFLLRKQVVDRTGLAGKYDVELEWTPERIQMQQDGSAENGQPSIFTAIQQQLGLKLESGKAPIKMLVVDRVERPSEN